VAEETAENVIEGDGGMTDEQWEEWPGGDKPVGTFAKVEVRLRNGEVIQTYAGGGRWDHQGRDTDVVAWRRSDWEDEE
jgi:hypothetical protein